MSETRAVTLETSVDTTGARAGFQEIQREAGTMAQAVARASEQADTAVEGIGTSATASARNVDASTRNMINAIQRQTAALEAGSRSGSAYYEVLARQRGVDPAALEPYLAQLRSIEQTQGRANAAIGGASQPLRQAGVSAAQTANAMRQLPAQFTDVITSLQGGQAPLTVFLQQGGQIRDTFGSAGGAIRGVGGALAGMVNPLTVSAAALVALGVAYNQGSKEADAFTRALILSGNMAGTSSDQLAVMARNISSLGGTQSEAAAALTALASTGKVGADNLQAFATTAVGVQKRVGQSVDETAKQFAELGKAPVEASLKLNDAYHYLSASTYERIKSLQEQGRLEEAGALAQKTYADMFDERTKQLTASLGTVERAWESAGGMAKKAWDKFLNVGREDTIEEQIAKIDAQLAQKKNKNAIPIPNVVRLLVNQPDFTEDELKQKRAALEMQKQKRDWDAAQAAIAQQMNDFLLQWDQDGNKFLTRIQLRDNEIKRMRERGLAAGVSDKDMDDREKKIRQSYADLDNTDIAKLEANRTRRKAVLEGDMQSLENDRKLQLINAADYYAKKRDLDLQALALDLPILQATMAKDKKKEDQSAYQKDLGELQAYFTRRQNIINGAKNAIEQEANAPAKALKLQVAAWDRAIASQEQYGAQELKMFGQSDAARSVLIAQLRIEAEARKQIDDIRKDRKPTDEEIANINRAAAAAKTGMTAAINRSSAIAGAAQLREENRRYTLEGISDARQYSMAAIEIDARKWRELISNAKEGSDERKLIETEFNEWYANRQGEVDPWKAMQRALTAYGREASDVAGGIGQAMTNSFRSAENAFVSFVTTGKLSFRDLATSIIADLARIEARKAISSLASYALDFAMESFGQISNRQVEASHASEMDRILSQLPARANGGPVNSGVSYLVGEKGPEIFTPSNSGSITPNHLIGAGSGSAMSINFNTTITGNSTSTQSSGDAGPNSRAAVDALHTSFRQWLAGETRQGGMIWKLQQGRG